MILNTDKYAEIRNGNLIWKNNKFLFKALGKERGRFWYINLVDIHCFTDELIDTAIPLHIQHLIKNSSIKLMIVNYLEGFHIIVKTIYQRLILDKNFPEESIYFYSESANIFEAVKYYASCFNKKTIKTFYIRLTEFFTAGAMPHYTKNNGINIEKKFLLFNRRWRMHRPTLVGLLASRNLLEAGYVSLSKELENRNWSNSYDYILSLNSDNNSIVDLFIENKDKIIGLPSLVIDTRDFEDNLLLVNVKTPVRDFYSKSLFSVVSESNFYREEVGESSIFLTEKTYKAIYHRHPFILVSTPNSLKTLRSNGYKTFENIINEDYDSIENDADRMYAILLEVERLCKLSTAEVINFYNESQPICEHNYNLLTSRKKLDNCITPLD